jgi:putative component of toxin-antitoxin plasmid stabilization module
MSMAGALIGTGLMALKRSKDNGGDNKDWARQLVKRKGSWRRVHEYRIDFGYRIYFGRDGESLVILLAGGTKKRQQADIVTAQRRWVDYKTRKRKER